METFKFPNLSVSVELRDDVVVYAFDGDVNENFDFNQLPVHEGKKCLLKLAKINNFNSCGIREWIYFIQKLENSPDILFDECSVAVIDQVNMVPDSLGPGSIESFYAPYYCPCDDGSIDKLIDFEASKHEILNNIAPEFKCEKCGEDLEFDALEDSYFLFVSGMLSKAV